MNAGLKMGVAQLATEIKVMLLLDDMDCDWMMFRVKRKGRFINKS